MHKPLTVLALAEATLASRWSSMATAQGSTLPHLERRGCATQLVVDGKPFLVLGGETRNSSSSDLAYMAPIWPKLKAMTFRAPPNLSLVHLGRWAVRGGFSGRFETGFRKRMVE